MLFLFSFAAGSAIGILCCVGGVGLFTWWLNRNLDRF